MYTPVDVEDELEAIIKILDVVQGSPEWQVLAFNLPTVAKKAIVAHNRLGNEFAFSWNIYQKPLELCLEILQDAKALKEHMEADPNYVSCDDPYQLRLGFAWHKPEEGKSYVRQISIADLKRADDEVVRYLIADKAKVIGKPNKSIVDTLQSTAPLMDALQVQPTYFYDAPQEAMLVFVWTNPLRILRLPQEVLSNASKEDVSRIEQTILQLPE